MKFTFEVPGGTGTIETEDDKEAFRSIGFWSNLPKTCPVDDSATRVHVRQVDESEYFEIISCGKTRYRYPIGVHKPKNGGGLYPKNQWVWWDWENKEEVILFEFGRLTEAGMIHRERALCEPPVESLSEVQEIDPNPDAAIFDRLTQGQRADIEELAPRLYNGDWRAKIANAVKFVSGGKTWLHTDLSEEQADQLIAGMHKKINELSVVESYDKAAQLGNQE